MRGQTAREAIHAERPDSVTVPQRDNKGKHPWAVRRAVGPDNEFLFHEINDASGKTIVSTWTPDDELSSLLLITLFIAAPDMLAVCQQVACEFDDAKYPHSVEGRLRDLARAAIAKATGAP